MNEFLAWHKVQPVVDCVYPLAQIKEALRHLEAGSHFGKVCVQMAPDSKL